MLAKYITKKEAVLNLRNSLGMSVLAHHESRGNLDLPLRRLMWQSYISKLLKDRLITESQSTNWKSPW